MLRSLSGTSLSSPREVPLPKAKLRKTTLASPQAAAEWREVSWDRHIWELKRSWTQCPKRAEGLPLLSPAWQVYWDVIDIQGFPGGSVVRNPPASVGDVGFIPASGGCPGEGNGNPLQYSCLENPMDKGAWLATVPRGGKRDTTLQLSNNPL